jgi:hypothetical protein
MINYIQQLLPRLREFSSQLDKKELFVDKLFTLLQPNNEVHQYTFNRDGRLFLAKNGKTIEGTWELLNTGQLFIKRGKNDKITLDFDFLHPDVLIMKLGGTSDNPFIIYRQEKIENGNVLKFLQLLNAKNRGETVYELPGCIISESDLNDTIKDENYNIYNGYIYSLPYSYNNYTLSVRNVKDIRNGSILEEFYEVKYIAYNHNFDYILIFQKSLSEIQIGDMLIGCGPIARPNLTLSEYYLQEHKCFVQFNHKNEIISLKKSKTAEGVILVVFVAAFLLFILILLIKLA